MSTHDYAGSELELFSHALNWKAYWSRQLLGYLQGSALDVGAGLGATIQTLSAAGAAARWTALEPDPAMSELLRHKVAAGELPAETRVVAGTSADLDREDRYSAVLYIDVLEHIEDDRGELEHVSDLLVPGGRLIVLAPARPFLYTPFDHAVGHYRRYTRASLARIIPDGLAIEQLRYLDSVGLLASLANRLALRAAMPTPAQIGLWDRLMVPMSRWLDPLTFGRLGKSVLLIARKA